MVILDPLDEGEGPGPDRAAGEVVALLLGRLGRDHHPGSVGQRGEKRGGGLAQVELDRRVVDDLDGLQLGDLSFTERLWMRLHALHIELDGSSVEVGPVVELDALLELEDVGLWVRCGPGSGELRLDAEVLVQSDQGVIDALIDLAIDSSR